MDEVARSFYDLKFKVDYLTRSGDAFQGFFSSIMEMRYPADFIRVRPWGKVGDRKNDGYLKSKRMIFQSYAPNEMRAKECLSKIDEDFHGALPHWKSYFDTWVFVHNSFSGLGPEVTEALLALEVNNTPLKVTYWGFAELRREAMQLCESDLVSLLGHAPSRYAIASLGLEDLAPILDQITLLPATPCPDLRPVPADKLQRNMLSDFVAILLRAGMSRANLVRKYFRDKPTLQDRIAESFRSKYQELRSTTASPDDIFVALQQFAGGNVVHSPNRQSAVLAVLAFFFEECDIFERPDAEVIP